MGIDDRSSFIVHRSSFIVAVLLGVISNCLAIVDDEQELDWKL